MSGNEIKTFYDERREKWRLLWGNETFYDSENRMVEFDTEAEALEWWASYPRITGVEVIITTSPDCAGDKVGSQCS